MHFAIGHKLAAVVVLPALVAAALSVFTIVEVRSQNERTSLVDRLAVMTSRTDDLAQTVQNIVVAADAVAIEQDRTAAKARLDALRTELGSLDTAERSFLDAVRPVVAETARTQISLRLANFRSYQTDTAELGLTISPQAAQIQANDQATIANRLDMVTLLQGVKADLQTRTATERAHIQAMQEHTAYLLVAVPCIVIIAGLTLAARFVRLHLRRPLEALRDTMEQLAEGRLDASVPLTCQRDEIGRMARTLTVFRDALASRQEVARADDLRSRATTARADQIVGLTREFEARALGLMCDLRASVANMGAAADEVAAASAQTQDEARTCLQAAEDASSLLSLVSKAADDLSVGAADISSRVEATHAAARDALQEADDGEAQSGDLVAVAHAIGGAAGLIQSIARQTKSRSMRRSRRHARARPAVALPSSRAR